LLIVNEVITNILKHAFDDDTEDGRIIVSAKEEQGNPDFDKVMSNKTLGLQLINTLAQQLEANYSYESMEQGAKFILSFQKADLKGIGSVHIM
jgi:two-component sensor histidine kinase